MQYMSAVRLAHAKEIRDDGPIVEIVIWRLSEPLPRSQHLYKYRLYYGEQGVSRVRYDNERGKATAGTLVMMNRNTSLFPSSNCWKISGPMLRIGGSDESSY